MKSRTLLLALVLLMALPASSAGAAGRAAPLKAPFAYVVNTLDDPGSVTCAPSPQPCSLRTAMGAANTDGGDSTITFSVTGTITLSSELPRVTDTTGVTIIDAGSNWIDINGNDSVRLFSVDTGAGLTLKNLILEHGYTTGNGGIIYNNGVLTVIHCSLLNSQANSGGAIYTTNAPGQSGAITDVSQSYMAFNTGVANGGAIYNAVGNAFVTNSTFYHNTASDGAVVANGSGWSITITNSTITRNFADGAGAASLRNFSGLLSLRNTIVDSPVTGVNCAGNIYNMGNNIDRGTTCGWGSNLGSKSSANPRLESRSGSGPSTVYGLLPSSPAVDGVTNDPANCPTVDQRGVARPLDGNRDGIARCDIGAYELMPTIYLPLIIQ